MADEFVKGFGTLSGAGLVWLVLAGWYRTPSFEGVQLIAPVPSSLTAFDQLAVALMGVAFWVMILGTVAFWIGVPVAREVYTAVTND